MITWHTTIKLGGNAYIKKKIYKAKVVIQRSGIESYHLFHLRPRKYLEMLILAAPFLLLTKVILQWPYVILKIKF